MSNLLRMVLKLFKGAWFLSVTAVLASLLYVYASLPEQVIIHEKSSGLTMANREFLFYSMTGVIMLINVLVYMISRLFAAYENFRSWFHGLVISINIFLIIAMSFVQVYNSAERFDFSRVTFLIYGSIGLILLWAASWPLYSIFRKIFAKPVIS